MNRLKPFTIALGILSIVLLALVLRAEKKLADLKSNVRLAGDLAWSYNTTRDDAVGKDLPKAIACLERLILPPGTQQALSGPAGAVAEEQRQRAVRDIISYLQTETGKDYGPEPQKWVDAFGSGSLKAN